MKTTRPSLVLTIIATLIVVVTLQLRQRMQIHRLRESRRHLSAEYQDLSDKYAALQRVAEARNTENTRLQNEVSEILGLRSQVTQLKRQLAKKNGDQGLPAGSPTEPTGYIKKEQLEFAGFDTPEGAFQSMRWAALNHNYTNWVASLAPPLQQEELANPSSAEEFQRSSMLEADTKGMQILDAKSVGDDRMELKVRLDRVASTTILIFPMVAIGSEWRLGDEIRAYSEEWDHPTNAR